jgi:lipid-binding SYLF domain-containing protein
MDSIRIHVLALMLAIAAIVSMSVMNQAGAATAADLDKDSQQALQTLFKTEPVAKTLSRTAKAVLVFPNIIKAGLVFGGSYGEGELIEGSKVVDYYNSVAICVRPDLSVALEHKGPDKGSNGVESICS